MAAPLISLAELEDLLQGAAVAGWRDSAGNTALHHAARLGSEALAGRCLEQGIQPSTLNAAGECARDVARAWGHDAVAATLDVAMQQEPAQAALPYKRLADIRAQSGLFYKLAAEGRFPQVAALAEKTGEPLTAADLLETGPGGDTAVLKICLHGQLKSLLRPALWADGAAEASTVLEAVPAVLKSGIDVESFLRDVRQTRLQVSRQVRPVWKRNP